MQDLPSVSVLMPVRNEAAFVGRSITSVLSQDYPDDRLEVIVADGMSEDGTRAVVEFFQDQHPRLRMIDNPGRIVATGLNAALHKAGGDIIIRVDGHCEIAPDYIRRCVGHLLNDDVDAVGGPLETIGETQMAQAIASAMSSRFGVGDSAFRVCEDRTLLADTVAFPAYKREAITRAGLFDEELVRNQDDEYNYRLRKLGGRILLAADVRSRYYSRSTLTGLWQQYFQYGYWKVRVMQKHPRQMQWRQFVPPLFVAALLVSALTAPFSALGRLVFALVSVSYLIANLAASVLSAQTTQTPWRHLALLPPAFVTLHLAYGFGFLTGMVRFWNRWGDHATRLNHSGARGAELR